MPIKPSDVFKRLHTWICCPFPLIIITSTVKGFLLNELLCWNLLQNIYIYIYTYIYIYILYMIYSIEITKICEIRWTFGRAWDLANFREYHKKNREVWQLCLHDIGQNNPGAAMTSGLMGKLLMFAWTVFRSVKLRFAFAENLKILVQTCVAPPWYLTQHYSANLVDRTEKVKKLKKKKTEQDNNSTLCILDTVLIMVYLWHSFCKILENQH